MGGRCFKSLRTVEKKDEVGMTERQQVINFIREPTDVSTVQNPEHLHGRLNGRVVQTYLILQ